MTAPAGGRATSPAARLARAGFADPAAAAASLDALDLPAGSPVVEDLAGCADPDRALRSLERLLAAAPDRQDLRAALADSAGLRGRLLAVLGASAALGDHLAAEPGDWHVLADEALVLSRPSALGLQRAMLDAVGVPGGPSPAPGAGGGTTARPEVEAVRALRLAYRRALLALAARDLSGAVVVDDVAAELADLASGVLAAGLAVAAARLPGGAAPCRLAVVAMGKCGGRELNYVSDVDVVFVAEPLDGGDEQAALASATALASGMMRVCGLAAWPVDAALRPEGKAGPLVRTLASHEAYYRRWARTWEFQALLKARPVAGDLALGQAYVERLAPLVWTASERPHFVADVQEMRRRVERTLPPAAADRELKLGPGGLRDVEFAVQLLQLVHGRGDDSVRTPTTLVALDALASGGYVGREDARALAESYRWLRTVEHRLQLDRLRRTHVVPEDEAALRVLARGLGHLVDPVERFTRERRGYARTVRRLHEKLFYRPLLEAVARLPAEDARLTPQAARHRLEALGFHDPAGALRHLEALTTGVSRRAAIQRTLLPAMLGWFAGAPDPDAGLLAFRKVSDELGTTPWYLRLLRDEGTAAERLAHLLATSRYVTDLLQRAPEAVRMLADDGELQPRSRETLVAAFRAAAGRRDHWEETVATVRALRRHEVLRTASADLLGRLDAEGVGRALSDVAAATLAAALDTATRKIEAERRAELPVRIAVVAMGRLGGAEQGYGSDADVLFVHEPLDGVEEATAAAVAQDVCEELRRLLALPAADPPLLVDAGLRPEGRQGALTRSLKAYARYYGTGGEAAVWEAQALLRAAPLAGDADLTGRLLALVAPVRWPEGGLSDGQVREVRRIKARVEAERLPRGADRHRHPKLGPGGLADVEWTVQLLQLRYAYAVEGLRTPRTLDALAAAAGAGLLAPADADVLRDAWRLGNRVRDLLVLVRGRAVDLLPGPGRDLEGVARGLGYGAGDADEFLDDYRRTTRRARAVVERVFFG